MPIKTVFLVILAASLAALGFAFGMQHFAKLAPCHLCLLQRWPYAFTTALGVIGLVAVRRDRTAAGLLTLTALAFACETALAAYHAGVERHWWVSAFETCRASFSSAVDILAQIEARPAARCDEVAWSFLGLSMADWNIPYAAGLTLFAGWAAIASGRRPARR